MSFDAYQFSAEQFTKDWIATWNRRDIEAVLSHYAETATFITPKAEPILGRTEARNKAELRHYWTTVSAKIDSIVFTHDRAFWDPVQQVLTMLYVASFNGVSWRATEIITFDENGKIKCGEALYGAPIMPDVSTVDA